MPERYLRIRTIIQVIQYLLDGKRPTELWYIHSLSLAEGEEQSRVTNQQLLTYILRYLQENQDQSYPVHYTPQEEDHRSSEGRGVGIRVPT